LRLEDQITTLTLQLRYEAAASRVILALHAIRDDLLEHRYSPDQPRVPAGSSDGGQWTSDGGQTSTPSNRVRRIAEIGERVLAWKEPGMINRYIYKFKYFMVLVDAGQRVLPEGLSDKSPLIRAGRLLNDNIKR